VQRAFPNPTDTSDPNHSYYHWYGREQPPSPIDPDDDLWRQLSEVRAELAKIRNSRSYRAVRQAAGIVRGRWFRRGAA
jgi:hypothetical protein